MSPVEEECLKTRLMPNLVVACIFTLAAPVYFVVQTALADQLGAAPMTAALAVATLAIVTLVTGVPRADEIREMRRPDIVKLVLAGTLGIFGSQYLVLANRYSDAPPGSEVIFFTTAAWGLLAVLAGFVVPPRPTLQQLIAGGIALAGAAAVLANWERPSSFSPFVRYPTEHLAMLGAGACWAAFGALIADLGRRFRMRAILPPAAAVAALVSVGVALISPAGFELASIRPEVWVQLLIASCAFAATVIAWAMLLPGAGVVASGAVLFLPAVTLTLLGVYERRVSAAGPSPLLWNAAAWASAVAVAGALGVAALGTRAAATTAPRIEGRPESADSGGLPRWLALAAGAVTAAGCAAALVALWTPALAARVRGVRGGGAAYAASWSMPGAETPAAWIALLAGALTLVSAFVLVRTGRGPMAAIVAGLVSATALAGVPALLMTPLRTWTRWIPGEVQQDYGTEYARLYLERSGGSATWVALVVLGFGVTLTLGAAFATWHRSRGIVHEVRSTSGTDSKGRAHMRSDGTA